MQKGSREWFLGIAKIIGEYLMGIEVSHYGTTVQVIPRCQVTFILDRFFVSSLPIDFKKLEEFEGFRQGSFHVNRGDRLVGNSVTNMRCTVLYDFEDEEVCPRETMLEVASVLGFTVIPNLLNNDIHTSRHSSKIYLESQVDTRE